MKNVLGLFTVVVLVVLIPRKLYRVTIGQRQTSNDMCAAIKRPTYRLDSYSTSKENVSSFIYIL